MPGLPARDVSRRAAQGRAPRAVVAWGVCGLLPFLALSCLVATEPAWRGPAAEAEALYAGLILSFLGGVRFGFAIPAASPSGVIAAAMAPTTSAFALLILLHDAPAGLLLGMAAALMTVWAWDLATVTAPVWYGRLRTALTVPAVVSLLMAAIMTRS